MINNWKHVLGFVLSGGFPWLGADESKNDGKKMETQSDISEDGKVEQNPASWIPQNQQPRSKQNGGVSRTWRMWP